MLYKCCMLDCIQSNVVFSNNYNMYFQNLHHEDGLDKVYLVKICQTGNMVCDNTNFNIKPYISSWYIRDLVIKMHSN
jgi:hypothetical protein